MLTRELGANSKNDDLYVIRCGKCGNLGAASNDVRVVEEAHHVVIDPEIKKRSVVKKHPRPKVIDHSYAKVGKLYCIKCNMDWGIMALYRNIQIPMIKVG